MDIANLPAYPMQPFIEHIRAMGVTGRIVLWCSAADGGFIGPYQHWTAFVGDEEMQFSAYETFENLTQAISVKYLGQREVDPIALGM